jgi:hypothetical protein
MTKYSLAFPVLRLFNLKTLATMATTTMTMLLLGSVESQVQGASPNTESMGRTEGDATSDGSQGGTGDQATSAQDTSDKETSEKGVPSCQDLIKQTLDASEDGRANEVCERARLACFSQKCIERVGAVSPFSPDTQKKLAQATRQEVWVWRHNCAAARRAVAGTKGSEFIQSLSN